MSDDAHLDDSQERALAAGTRRCVALVDLDDSLPVSAAELDALELLLGADLRSLFSR